MHESKRELKPCPFCGGEAAPYIVNGNYGYTPDIYGIKCTRCGATIEKSSGYADLSETVAEAWNKRSKDNG